MPAMSRGCAAASAAAASSSSFSRAARRRGGILQSGARSASASPPIAAGPPPPTAEPDCGKENAEPLAVKCREAASPAELRAAAAVRAAAFHPYPAGRSAFAKAR